MNDGYDHYEIGSFKPGQRIEMHPATDLFMMGARYGSVVKVGRTTVHVRLDRASGIERVALGLLRPIDE